MWSYVAAPLLLLLVSSGMAFQMVPARGLRSATSILYVSSAPFSGIQCACGACAACVGSGRPPACNDPYCKCPGCGAKQHPRGCPCDACATKRN
mmetsp:Transcript_15312/g.46365  ORF Transcript_15312/g.46365 Transcript_15312/m.46365 type:complete len:94 (+) Transcript_15312:43-324(+)